MTSPDPSSWPDAPPPLPPTIPPGPAPGTSGWGAPAGAVPTAPAHAPAPPPRPPSSTRAGLVAAAVAVVVVLALAGTFLVVRTVSGDDTAAPATTAAPAPATTERTGPTSSTSAPGPAGPGGTATPDDVQAEVDEISAFVEQERGLRFDEPVPVTALGADDFKARVLEEFESDTASLETQGALLRAGGVVPADVDVVQSQLDLLGDGVLGFYDPVSGELVVRSDSAGPMVRSVIAHELTHALDDQHFDLDRPELTDLHDGSDWAFLALVEGSATRVEDAYLDQLSPEDQDQLAADQLQLGLDQMTSMLSTPLVLAQILMSPYDYGAPFVQSLVDEGGTARLDEAFGRPPVSSEQILDPTRFDEDAPVTVERPPADGEILDEGVLGELFTGFLLTESSGVDDLLGGIDPNDLQDMLDNLDMDELQDMIDQLGTDGGTGGLGGIGGAGALASGFPPVATTEDWGGDHYVMWKAGDQVCLRADWVMDSPEALVTFRASVDAWAARDTAVVVAEPGADSVRITRCSA